MRFKLAAEFANVGDSLAVVVAIEPDFFGVLLLGVWEMTLNDLARCHLNGGPFCGSFANKATAVASVEAFAVCQLEIIG